MTRSLKAVASRTALTTMLSVPVVGFFVVAPVLDAQEETPTTDSVEAVGQPVAEPSVFEGAGSSLVPLAQTRVRREIEDLTLYRETGSWRIEAVDVFVAGPAPETVTIGLPDFEGVTESGERVGTLQEVSLAVDGVEVAASLEPPPVTADLGAPGGIGRIYSWTLRFGSDESKVIRLRYRVRASLTRQGDELLFYYLNTGTPWAGPSGRINVRVDLGESFTEDLVLGWLRPRTFAVAPHASIWRLADEEPVTDLVVAVRPFQNPLERFDDREAGILSLPREDWEPHLESATAKELYFWRDFLRARRGEQAQRAEFVPLFESESWYRPLATGVAPRPWKTDEEILLQRVSHRLQEWEAALIPTPEELRSSSG